MKVLSLRAQKVLVLSAFALGILTILYPVFQGQLALSPSSDTLLAKPVEANSGHPLLTNQSAKAEDDRRVEIDQE